MIKRSALYLSCLVFGVVVNTNAGSYTMKPYGDNFIKPASVHDEVEKIEAVSIESGALKIIGEGSTKESNSVESETTGEGYRDSLGWISGLGKINAQYHKDVQAMVARQRSGTSYVKISSADNIEGLVITGKLSGPTNFATAIARQSNSIYRNAYDAMINSLASRHGVPTGLVKAVMHTESSFNQNARSHAGAQGLMQLMPATARRFNVTNAYDPYQNIEGGVRYLSWLIKRYNGDLRLALAGYNAGEGNVDKYGGIPPFKETKQYVVKVMERYHSLYTGN